MKVSRINDIAAVQLSGPLFDGVAQRQSLVSPTESELNVGIVSFPRGVRNRLHTHTGDQVLIVTKGRGIVATEHETRTVSVGDVIFFPAGERHWHGATDDSDFAHIVITCAGSETLVVESNSC